MNNNSDKKKPDITENVDESDIINNMAIITDALDYYDKFQEKYRDDYLHINYISLELTDKDLEHNIIIFYDSELK